MKDEYRFVTAIHIDNQKFPEIKEDNLGSLIAGYVEKMAVKRVKAFDIAIIDNIREIGRENGIDLLAVIDEEKLLNMVLRLEEQDKVLKIIKELFDFDFAIRFGDNQPMIKITNKRNGQYWELPETSKICDLLKEYFR